MKKSILIMAMLCVALIFSNCAKDDASLPVPTASTGSLTKSTGALRGMNWADPNGNEGPSRVVLPSGLTSTMTASAAATVGTRISTAVKASGGTTIRMPINYWTTASTSYWPVYQAAINAIVANGCNVILCYWPTTGHSVSDVTQWNYLWDKVDGVYKSNTKVLYEPINEPVDYSGTDLCNLYANFLTRYSPSSWKCILDGTGYAGEVITVGNDSRLSSQYLGLHCYWWFWGSYNVWSGAYNKMASLVGNYASRTVVTEIGVETMRTINFWWQWQTGAEPDVAFLTGSLAYAKDNQIGTIAWSGINDIDSYRWFMANDNLVEVNPGCANMFRWSWGQAAKWIGPIANGNFKLKNRASGLMLDNLGATTDGANVGQWANGTSSNQIWSVSYVAGYYILTCTSSGKCLDTGGNTADGSTVQQWVRGSSTNQHWTITSLGSGYYKLTNRATGKCLDTGGLTANGSAIQQWYSGTSNNQQWTFVAQ